MHLRVWNILNTQYTLLQPTSITIPYMVLSSTTLRGTTHRGVDWFLLPESIRLGSGYHVKFTANVNQNGELTDGSCKLGYRLWGFNGYNQPYATPARSWNVAVVLEIIQYSLQVLLVNRSELTAMPTILDLLRPLMQEGRHDGSKNGTHFRTLLNTLHHVKFAEISWYEYEF